MARPRKSNRERFESFIEEDEKTGCWLWKGSKTQKGYGLLKVRMPNDELKTCLAHRFSYQEYVGEIPSGMHVLHRCDNPSCVRYDGHLFIGTNADNMADRNAKGRTAVGSAHGKAKYSESDVLEVRRLSDSGQYTQEQIATMTGMSRSHVGNIINRRKWKHL